MSKPLSVLSLVVLLVVASLTPLAAREMTRVERQVRHEKSLG